MHISRRQALLAASAASFVALLPRDALANSQSIFITVWIASRAVTTNDWCYSPAGTATYKCTTAGTTAASGGPTGTGTGISDGTAKWDWVANGKNGIVPSDWDSTNNAIHCIGEGGNGGGTNHAAGGGGGEWRKSTGISLTPSASFTFDVGSGGTGTDTKFNSTTVVAKAGGTGANSTNGAGGAGGTGTSGFAGGYGSHASGKYNGGAGGGAGGPYGAGGHGGVGGNSNNFGMGGGGNGGGSNGVGSFSYGNGAGGGNNHLGVGGAPGLPGGQGQAGFAGGGGAGGTAGYSGGAGGPGNDLDASHGGGGGAGGNPFGSTATAANGGLFGGGGGARSDTGGANGVGAPGLIFLSWGVVVPAPDIHASVFRIRTGGNNLNGGGFNSTATNPGTDYSQQDAAQASGTHGTAAASATFDDTTANAFTSQMVGNAILISSGTGFTVGVYFVSEYVSSSRVVLDRSPGTGSAGVWRLGGAWADPWTNITSTYLVSGNVVYIRGAGGNYPTTDDYTKGGGGFITLPVGDAGNGWIKLIGENGRPRLSSNGCCYALANSACNWLEGLVIGATGTNAAANGIVGAIDTNGGRTCTIVNCLFDQHGNDIAGIARLAGSYIGNEITSTTGGSGGSAYGMLMGTEGGFAYGNFIHDTVGPGLNIASRIGQCAYMNIIAKCHGVGINIDNTSGGAHDCVVGVINNTVDGNTGDGIAIASAAFLIQTVLINNLVTNHTGGGKSGLLVSGGSVAANNLCRAIMKNNWYYNNTASATGVTLDASDVVGTDPSYTAQSTEGYYPGTPANNSGFPAAAFVQTLAGQTPTQTYWTVGAVQKQDAS